MVKKDMIQEAYQKTEIFRWFMLIISVIFTQLFFNDYFFTLFLLTSNVLIHELPSVYMALFLLKKERSKDV